MMPRVSRSTCPPSSPSRAELRPGALALCALLAACGSAPDHYHTRGLVKAREGSGADARVAIHHERIEGFKDREGKRAPMPSMAMLFGRAPAVDATPLAPGDKLAFDFEVHWTGSPTLRITQLTTLPADTPLTLSDH
jgi:hypothetical protein